MNNYWHNFRNIGLNINKVTSDHFYSPEMQNAATSLNKSIEPCITEIQRSASALKQLTQVCIQDVEQAENIWLSKPKIAAVPTSEIWEQIGELTGLRIKLALLGEKLKKETITEVNQLWQAQAKNLRNSYFWDERKKIFKNSLNFFEKDTLFKQLNKSIDSYSNELYSILKEALKNVSNDIESLEISGIQKCVEQFDIKTKSILLNNLQTSNKQLISSFVNAISPPNYFAKGFQETLNIPIETLVQKSMMGVSFEQFEECIYEVLTTIEKNLQAAIDNRINLAIKLVEESVLFCNTFLDKQTRYRQETPEQREAEKAWIDQQRRQLAQVQQGTETILEAGSFADSLS